MALLAARDINDVLIEAGATLAGSALESLMWESRGDRARVSRILEPIYRERSDWKDLVDALDVQIQSSEDGSDRLELLHPAVHLRDPVLRVLADVTGLVVLVPRREVVAALLPGQRSE